MPTINKLDMVTLAKESLQEHVRDRIEADLIEDLLARAKPQIRELVEQITFERIESFKDVALMRNELLVRISINGEEERSERY